jgi:serine/threonine protein kinase
VSQRTLEAGSAIGQYLVDSVLGLGQCGITYLGRSAGSNAVCVIKEFFPRAHGTRGNDMTIVALPDCEEDLQLGVRRFISDASTLTGIRHPGIVRVDDVIEANNTAYMVMAHEPGERLSEAVKRGFVATPDALLRLALTLIDATMTLHRVGLIHRDIKENNVHLRADGSPVLLDFGAARVGLLRRRLALGNAVRGDADYNDLDGNAGPWTDIHALAAMLFRLASSQGRAGTGSAACPTDLADAIRLGIAANQGNFTVLLHDWGSGLQALARDQYPMALPIAEVEAPTPPADEPVSAVDFADARADASAARAPPGSPSRRAWKGIPRAAR